LPRKRIVKRSVVVLPGVVAQVYRGCHVGGLVESDGDPCATYDLLTSAKWESILMTIILSTYTHSLESRRLVLSHPCRRRLVLLDSLLRSRLSILASSYAPSRSPPVSKSALAHREHIQCLKRALYIYMYLFICEQLPCYGNALEYHNMSTAPISRERTYRQISKLP
jgi:hypothetical protein